MRIIAPSAGAISQYLAIASRSRPASSHWRPVAVDDGKDGIVEVVADGTVAVQRGDATDLERPRAGTGGSAFGCAGYCLDQVLQVVNAGIFEL
jgi:hypothetical protein